MNIVFTILILMLLSGCGTVPVPVNDTIVEVNVEPLAEAVKFLGGGLVLAAAVLGLAGFFANRK